MIPGGNLPALKASLQKLSGYAVRGVYAGHGDTGAGGWQPAHRGGAEGHRRNPWIGASTPLSSGTAHVPSRWGAWVESGSGEAGISISGLRGARAGSPVWAGTGASPFPGIGRPGGTWIPSSFHPVSPSGISSADLPWRILSVSSPVPVGYDAVPSFGIERLHCKSHLFHRSSNPRGEVIEAMASLGLTPVSTTLKKE